MSHIVEIRTEIRDVSAIQAACRRLQLAPAVQGEARLFSESRSGWLVELPEWRYPLVCDVEQGRVLFDNFGGRWGQQSRLDQFLQAYAVERAKSEARRQGHSVTEQPLADGSIQLTVSVGGAT